MTDGQVFYFTAAGAFFVAVILEHLWKKWRRRCAIDCPPNAPWHCECRAKGKR